MVGQKTKNMILAVVLALLLGGIGLLYASRRNGLLLAAIELVTGGLFRLSTYWAESGGNPLGWVLAVFFITLFMAAWVIGIICAVVSTSQHNRAG